MAEFKTPAGQIGIARQAPKPQVPPAQPKTTDQLLRESIYREGYEKGRHEKGVKNFWHGSVFTLVIMGVSSLFIFMVDAGNRERNMIESRVAVTGAISNAKLLAEENALPRAVVEPDGK
jgi:hypothetical protein